MNKFLLSLILATSCQSGHAINSPWQNMPLLGEGTLNIALWKIYKAELYSYNTPFIQSQPFALRLSYMRDIDKKDLLDETQNQFNHLEIDSTDASRWLNKLDNVWRDVNKNDVITLYVDEDKHAHFFLNGGHIGEVSDPEFSQAFADIWLSKKSSRPKLRKKLLGEK